MASFFDEVNQAADVGSVYRFQAKPKAKKKASLVQSLLPSVGGIAGGVGGGAAGGALAGSLILPGVGTVAGGLIGALLGGAAGGGAGKVAQNISMGESATKDVARTAALEGVLSAGPIRLAKGAVGAARAAKGSGNLVDALNVGGAASAAPSAIKTTIADKLGAGSESMAAKALGLTKGQKNTYLEKTGEKAGATAKKYGITTAEDVPAVTKPLYGEYSAAIKQIPRTFSKTELDGAFKGVYQPLLAKGQPLGQQAVGERIKAEADNLLKGVTSKGISAAELNTKRQAFDKLAYKAKGTDPNLYDVNKNARDVLAKMVQGAADSAGIKTASGKTLKEAGNELNKLNRLGKAANKNVEGAGGSMQIGLGALPLTVAGGASGPLGAGVGLATNMAINSAPGRRAIAGAADSTAARMANSAARTANNPVGLRAVSKRVAPVGVAGALLNEATTGLDQSLNSQMTETTAENMNMPNSSNMLPTDYSANAEESISDSPFAPQNVEANVAQLVASGAKMKEIQDYLSIAKTVQAMTGTKAGKGLNSEQQKASSNALSGLSSLETIASTLRSNPNASKLAALPGGSLVGSLTGTGEYKAAVANATDVIGRLRSGGAITKDEENRFLRLLPQAFDDPATAEYKINQVASLFQKFASPTPATPDTSSLVAALGG